MRGIIEPTEIQTQVIPKLLAGEKLAFRSATGTGKTLAYLLPLVQLISSISDPRKRPLGLVCAPSAELASQIKSEAEALFAVLGFDKAVVLLTGDANLTRQIDRLKKTKPLVLIGTMGRLVLVARMGKLSLDALRFVVLDEADRFALNEALETIKDLIAFLPPGRTGAACSATLPHKAASVITSFLGGKPVHIDLDDAEVLRERIDHWAVFSEGRRKIDTLWSFISASHGRKFLVFTNRNGQIANICGRLLERGLPVAGLFGNMDKVARKKAITDFRSDRISILITSDLAARGLDIIGVDHVVALDVPENPSAYAHRAGRTGRAGGRGVMTTIGDAVELPRLSKLEKRLGITIFPKIITHGRLHTLAISERGKLPQNDPAAAEKRRDFRHKPSQST